jgi:hypothetical protein
MSTSRLMRGKRKGALIIWTPNKYLYNNQYFDIEKTLIQSGRLHAYRVWFCTFFCTGNTYQLTSPEQANHRRRYHQKMKNADPIDTIIIAGSEIPMIAELMIYDAIELKIPIWNFAHPGSPLDNYWHELADLEKIP